MNEDAINGANFKPQWPRHWTESPLAHGGTFHTLAPERRLGLLNTLTLWALGYSDAVKGMINANYNGKRTNDDLNQPLSVQPWGVDSDKRRYYLVEGDDNSSFRVYRESNPAALYNRQWISVAGSIDEVKELATKLNTLDGGPNARKLSNNILKNIVNFEEKEEKRKRREYRRQQKERFRRPEPGFSLYEGRTRGKRVKYTYSDEEDFYTDSTNRRSTRNTRDPSPVENGPIVTASGRQSRPPPRLTADVLSTGDASTVPSVQGDMDTEMSEAPDFGSTGRPRRSAAVHHGANGWANPRKRRKDFVSDDEDDDESEPILGDDEEDHIPQFETDDEEEFENDAMDEDDQELAADSPGSNGSRVVKLHIKVKFDKNGKAKRLLENEEPPSGTPPSNVASSPSGAYESPVDKTTDDLKPNADRTEDVVNVAPLKQVGSAGNTPVSNGENQIRPCVDTATSSLSSGSSTATSSNKSSGISTGVMLTGKENFLPASLTQTPRSPRPNASASLAFRGSPEKAQPALHTATTSVNQD